MHLVGFIIKKGHDAPSHERQKRKKSKYLIFLKKLYFYFQALYNSASSTVNDKTISNVPIQN